MFVAAMGSGNSYTIMPFIQTTMVLRTVSERAFSNGDEAKVVELNDGRVLMSVCQSGYRGYSISTDGGETQEPNQTGTKSIPMPATVISSAIQQQIKASIKTVC